MWIFFLVTLQVLPFQKFIVGKISHRGWRRGQLNMFNLRKIDLKLVFCYISPCNFFGKLPITHLISIKNKNKKNCGFMWLWDTFWSKKTNIGLNGHMGPLRGHNPIFFKTFFYSKIISLSIQMGSGRIIFYFNPLNGHYLYPPFFRNTKAKEEKNWPLTSDLSLKHPRPDG